MKNKTNETVRLKNFRRFISHFLHPIAKSGFLNSRMRTYLHSLRGVNFKDINSTFIGENVSIDGIHPENISIGKRCIITSGTKILSHYIDTENLSDDPNHYFRFFNGKVVIEDDVFIGLNVVIASPITIGKGSIVGANTVLTKDVAPGSVVAGVSARVIKNFKEI